jgi:hypothetical protein
MDFTELLSQIRTACAATEDLQSELEGLRFAAEDGDVQQMRVSYNLIKSQLFDVKRRTSQVLDGVENDLLLIVNESEEGYAEV